MEFQSIGQSSGCDLTCVQARDGVICVVAGVVERAGWHKLRAVFGRAGEQRVVGDAARLDGRGESAAVGKQGRFDGWETLHHGGALDGR